MANGWFALASFFVAGLGQGLKGEVVRGFKIFLGTFILSAGQIILGIVNPVLGWLMAVVLALYWFGNVLDAYGVWRLPI